jgi:hypothetical protein
MKTLTLALFVLFYHLTGNLSNAKLLESVEYLSYPTTRSGYETNIAQFVGNRGAFPTLPRLTRNESCDKLC